MTYADKPPSQQRRHKPPLVKVESTEGDTTFPLLNLGSVEKYEGSSDDSEDSYNSVSPHNQQAMLSTAPEQV